MACQKPGNLLDFNVLNLLHLILMVSMYHCNTEYWYVLTMFYLINKLTLVEVSCTLISIIFHNVKIT